MLILERIPMAPYTTLQVGGDARFFAIARSEADVVTALNFAADRSLKVFILGGGSNLLVADAGFDGLVLRIEIRGIAEEGNEGATSTVVAGAGESWDALVQYSVDRDLAGVECLAGIPGSVGGTPVQNVGAYGQEVGATITSVRAYDRLNECFLSLDADECGFGYRTSIFNTVSFNRYVVLNVSFELIAGGAPTIVYADLVRYFASASISPRLGKVAAAVRKIRSEKGMYLDPATPGDVDTHSAGSFFRNPIVSKQALEQISAISEMPLEKVPHWSIVEASSAGDTEKIKLASAWLLEHAGFHRGFAMGRAGISSKHTLALINRGGATAAEIVALRDRIIGEVQAKFGVSLVQEPVTLGF